MRRTRNEKKIGEKREEFCRRKSFFEAVIFCAHSYSVLHSHSVVLFQNLTKATAAKKQYFEIFIVLDAMINYSWKKRLSFHFTVDWKWIFLCRFFIRSSSAVSIAENIHILMQLGLLIRSLNAIISSQISEAWLAVKFSHSIDGICHRSPRIRTRLCSSTTYIRQVRKKHAILVDQAMS